MNSPAIKPSPQLMKLRSHVDARLVGMRSDRYSWWVHWRELADYLLPRRYRWLITPNQANRGSPINQRIIDNTATIAMRTLASGMMAGITSPGRPWFRLTLGDSSLSEKNEVKLWLEEVTNRMLRVFAESNFYNMMATLYTDLSAFGTAVAYIYLDDEDVIRCSTPACGEYFLANSSRMAVDTCYREFVYTVAQTAQEFGLENCSEGVRTAVKSGGASLTREIKIGHAIEPNDDRIPGALGLKGMLYREVYWELGTSEGTVLRVRGYHEKPFIAPRWDISGNDAYGRGPSMDALGDIKQLQVETKRKAQAIDKMVNPPMLADVALKNEPASLLPGGVTYLPNAAQSAGFKPVYEIKPEIAEMMQDIGEVQLRIKATFFTDLFMMISQLDTVRTATEVDARREEKMIQLGPVLERFENEALDPAIERVFNLMLRHKLFPPTPQSLGGLAIKVEYISMLAEAQNAANTASIERLAGFAGNIAGANPQVLDNIDFDAAIDIYANLLGVSPKIMLDKDKVKALRAQRAQQQQQQAVLQQSLGAAQGAKTLSQTDVGGGENALQKMMGVQ